MMVSAAAQMSEDLSQRQSQLAANVRRVRDRVADAAARAGRRAEEITLVAVTKYVDSEITRDLFLAGCQDLGENRPQGFWQKAEDLKELDIRWHFIGHLQRNKLRRTLPHVACLHSVDSPRLLEAIEEFHAARAGEPSTFTNVLIEVNVSGDAAKHGVHPDDCDAFLNRASQLEHVQVRGLMCMAGRGTSGLGARQDFAILRGLQERCQSRYPELDLSTLSMGMSGDFEEAIAEGSTMIRVGSILFEGIN